TGSTPGSPRSTKTRSPPSLPSPATSTVTSTPSATGSRCPTAPAPSKATSTASRCSNARCSAERTSTYSENGPCCRTEDHAICDRAKIRDGQVANRPIYVALAVTVEGNRDILGLWAGDGGEGAKHWQHVLTELKNRGVADVCMLVCDGLTGLPDAVANVWPQTLVQTCIVHLLRNSFRYAARQDWEKIARALKPVYTA